MKSALKNSPAGGGLVYSTDSGRMCPTCRQPVANCACKQAAAAPKTDGVVRVAVETKGRKGKGVTVIRGLGLDALPLAQLGKTLRTACGAGGTVKEGAIEIQGDHADTVIGLLKQQGLTVKRSGG